MRKFIHIYICCFICFSCEDVIDVELETSEPKLVIDASISWEKDTQGNEQEIELTLSAPYFDKTIPPATGASVTIRDTHNNTFVFEEEEQTGIYKNYTFIPEIEGVYTLTIIYENEIYTATETLKSVSSIDYVEQTNNRGFSENETELKAFYTDPENQENYYLFEFGNNGNMPSLEVYDDEFTNGNQIFGFFSTENLSENDVLQIKLSGISKRCYQYINVLLQQTDSDTGGPFETQPATVRGNCTNQTNPENFPFGYFRLTETDVLYYTIQ